MPDDVLGLPCRVCSSPSELGPTIRTKPYITVTLKNKNRLSVWRCSCQFWFKKLTSIKYVNHHCRALLTALIYYAWKRHYLINIDETNNKKQNNIKQNCFHNESYMCTIRAYKSVWYLTVAQALDVARPFYLLQPHICTNM